MTCVCVLYADSAGCSAGQACAWDTEWKSRYCKLAHLSQPTVSHMNFLSPPRRPKKASIQDAAVRGEEAV